MMDDVLFDLIPRGIDERIAEPTRSSLVFGVKT